MKSNKRHTSVPSLPILAADGTTAASYTYDAWGNCTVTGTAAIAELNPLRYRGYVYDTETQLYYLQSRYYDPEVGRFINADVFAATGQGFVGNNMFAYCGNNPINMYDPFGTSAVPISQNIIDSNNLALILEILAAAAALVPVSSVLVLVTVCAIVLKSDEKETSDTLTEQQTQVITQDQAQVVTRDQTQKKKEAVFYGVNRYNNQWNKVTGPMTFAQAVIWAHVTAAKQIYTDRQAWGLLTKNQKMPT